MRAGRLLIPLATLGLLLTSGCTAAGPEPGASESPSAGEPFFASEEEAVEAALAVYEEYNAMADQIMADGGAEPERLAPFVDEALLESQTAGFERMQEEGVVGSGDTSFQLHQIQQGPELGTSGLFLTAYVCLDVSETDLRDANGDSTVNPDRLDRIPNEVAWTIDADGSVRISKDSPWTAENFCS